MSQWGVQMSIMRAERTEGEIRLEGSSQNASFFAGKGVWEGRCASSLEAGRGVLSSGRQVSPHSSGCVSESHN